MYPFSGIIEKILAGEETHRLSGLWGSSKAFFLSYLFYKSDRSLFVITSTNEASDLLLTDLRLFPVWVSGLSTHIPLFSFPFSEILPYDSIPPHSDIIHERMSTYRALLAGNRGIFVLPVHSLIQRVMSSDVLKDGILKFHAGMEIERDSLLSHIVQYGYEPADIVIKRGTFGLRGGILDIFSPGEDAPTRIELFGDTIESIRTFDPETQRSVKKIESYTIMPAMESLLPENPCPINRATTFFDYVSDRALVVFDEIKEIKRNASEYWNRVWEVYNELSTQKQGITEPHELYLSPEELLDELLNCCGRFQYRIEMESLPMEGTYNISIKSSSDMFLGVMRDASPLKAIAGKLDTLRKSFTVILISPTDGQAERFRDILNEYNIPASITGPGEIHFSLRSTQAMLSFRSVPGEPQPRAERGGSEKYPSLPVIITAGNISSGFVYPEASLLIITEEEIFGKRVKRRPPLKQKARSFLTSFQDIKPGDYVVHVYHGVGQYDGLRRMAFTGGECDFLCIRYGGGDFIYVPVDNMDLVQKYIGAEGYSPHIDRLQGSRWENTKRLVEKAVENIAVDLLDLYAAREVLEGFSYSPDNYIMKEFEASFEYEETPDQLTAIEDMKRDMESRKPMDRLICGDVGYGKTEVALRASCKVVLDGKQVAILVPTTLLAQQHYQTFSKRFASFPVRVEMLSRFRSAPDQKKIIKDLADGPIDIIIGTQRLLQKDISFRELGLLIVDEEQRFGVAQKERLKQLRKITDVLTLSATPIPRTLQMSLCGIRDLSIIETPPDDRLAIRTILASFDKRIIRTAVLREFARDGRVFFVHNRVDSIDNIANLLQDLIPEARLGVAHGQMPERHLEKVMIRFINGDYNLLVCSTIIESGLDIPSANTIIINRADTFGLADLYQLRGRVGRSGHQAYAYLLVPIEESLTSDAKKRIKAIRDLTELGAGFRLAVKDLEIRGAGNLLGRQQSGHIAAVGFELYSQMLEKAVKRLHGEKVEEEINPTLNLKFSAFINEDYMEDPSQRLSFYKRLASVRSDPALISLREEMIDRYGPIPRNVENLFKIIEIKLLACASRVSKIERGDDGIFFTIDEQAIDRQAKNAAIALSGAKKVNILSALLSIYPDRIRFISEYTFLLSLLSKEPHHIFSEVINCLKVLGGCV